MREWTWRTVTAWIAVAACFACVTGASAGCGTASSSSPTSGSSGSGSSSSATSGSGGSGSSSSATSGSGGSGSSSSSTSGSGGSGGGCFYGDGGCFGLCCDGTCVDTTTDSNNCGYCGQVCPSGSSCIEVDGGSSACSPPCTAGTAGSCPEGMGCDPAGGVCVWMSCGAHGMQLSCALTQDSAGACCGESTCVDTNTDPANCGGCGVQCIAGGNGPDCIGGTCTTPPLDCATAPPNSPCVAANGHLGACCGTCVDTIDQVCAQVCPAGSTPAGGGACEAPCEAGSTCPDGSMCAGGFCDLECDQGGVQCPSGAACVPSPLGLGGTLCLPTSCGSGSERESCAQASGQPGVCCGSSCADVANDAANCGACGNACGAGEFCDGGTCAPAPTCAAGNSGVACPLPGGAGDGVCCAGACVAGFSDDPSNCGRCGAACPTGDTCAAGMCQGSSISCPANTFNDGNICLPVACPAGASGVSCAFGASSGGTCCDGVCVDTTSSPTACGACGNVCPSGACFGSACIPTPSSPAPPSCTAPDVYYVDPILGGECASPDCPAMLPVPYCAVAGQLGVCCSTTFLSATCVDPATDRENCGGCGQVCAASETCENGVCSGATAACGSGRAGALCDLEAGASWLCCGGACLDTSHDANNCGACGVVCASGSECLDAQCVSVSCSGQADGTACDARGALGACCSGACVDSSTDPTNCGSCGATCASSQTCEGAVCGVDACTPAIQGQPCHFDASGTIVKGLCCGQACVDPENDTNNCDGCGLTCNAGRECVGGSCQ